MVFTALWGLAATKLSTKFLDLYGWTLFVGLPVSCGFISVLLYSFHKPRSWASCVGVASLSVILLGLLITVFAIDGFICLVMAAPLACLFSLIGAGVAYFLTGKIRKSGTVGLTLTGILLLLPLVMGFESKLGLKPPLSKVVTSVDIKASPQTVWSYVIAFPPIPEPHDFIFKTGIAYPLNATIVGRGVGAVRYCNFSTGPFIEPIRVWNPPHLLKFAVTHNPLPMREWSPYSNLRPNHLHFMVSQAGQFKLIQLDAHTTRLEGTTWYHHRIWPTAYWNLMSDAIIHKIHLRVLNHIKTQAEREQNYNPSARPQR